MEQILDTLGRRDRWTHNPTRNPNYHPLDRDIAWFSFLHRHGGRLPTNYMHAATCDTHKDLYYTKERLMDLFYEYWVLSRPRTEGITTDPRWKELIHELNERSLDVLRDHELWSPYAPTMKGHAKHQLATGCISAAYELDCKARSIPYKNQIELLSAVNWPVPGIVRGAARRRYNPLTIDVGEKLIPDGVNWIKTDHEYLNFIELDRATEGVEAYKYKIRCYRKLIGHKMFKELFKVDCRGRLLFITTTEARRRKFLELVKEEFKSSTNPEGSCTYIVTAVMPRFGTKFSPPQVFPVLDLEWQTQGYGIFQHLSTPSACT